jgi:hypothetical protein
MNKRFLQPYYPKGLIRDRAEGPTYKDVCEHRYPEMSGVLNYRLRLRDHTFRERAKVKGGKG